MLAGVLVVVATSCQEGVWMGEPPAPKVSVIGDSLIYQAEGNYGSTEHQRQLAEALVADGYQAHVAGYVGETVELAYGRLWPKVSSEPDLDTLVIALGTNDVDTDVPLETSRSVLRQWLAEAAGVRCVALIGLNEQAFTWRLDIFGPAFNQMLHEEAALHPNASYVEWRPDLAIDGIDGDVHLPTLESQAQYRDTVRAAVDGCVAT